MQPSLLPRRGAAARRHLEYGRCCAAAGTLWNLAANNTANQDAIERLVELHRGCSALPGRRLCGLAKAAGALANLAAGTRNQDAIREAGAVPHLVNLLQAGDGSEAAQQAAGALRNLAANNTANKDAVREAHGIPPLVSLLRAGHTSLSSQKAAGALRNLAANNTPNQDLIREAGGIAELVTLLHAGSNSLAAQESAAALANLAAGNSTNKDAIREAGAITPLLQLLQPTGTEVAQHAFAAIANILSPVMALLQPNVFHTRDAEQTLAFIASIVPRGSSIDDFAQAATSAAGESTSATLLLRMQESAARRLQVLEGSADALELQRAVERARSLNLPADLITPVEARLHALE